MSELWIIGLVVFGAVVLGVEASYWLIRRSWQTNKSITRRLTLSRELTNRRTVLNALRAERSLFNDKYPLLRKLNDRLVQAGMRFDRGKLLLWVCALTAGFLVLGSVILGPGLLSSAAAILSAVGLTTVFLEMARQKLIARFTELLPDAIDVIVRGLRAGYPLTIALDLAAREMPDPIGSELGITSDEITFGQDLRTAIENLYGRVGQEDLTFFVVAINVQNQTGGNLAEALSRLSRLLRTRAKLRLKIRAMSAEGRISAVVLSLMPFILFGGISLISPSYFTDIRNDALVAPTLIYAAISLLIGNVMMYRMVHFRF